MTLRPATILVSFAVFWFPAIVEAEASEQPKSRILLAQDADGAGTSGATPDPVNTGTPAAAPAEGPPPVAVPAPVKSIFDTGTPTQPAPASKNAPSPSASQNPAPTTATRNGSVALPTLTQPGTTMPGPGSSSITFGGPQVDVQPVYGSTLRDNGSGNGGVPIYSNAPNTFGGPINGTANPYYSTLPNGSGTPGQTTSATRNTQVPNGNSYATQQPLGARPYSRDQSGTFGGTSSGYNAQGVYNGTAAQTGVGFGSPYASNGRPTGGLLSTGVDATGPLRPYIPLNNSPIGRPNSGYGISNGSRSTHMDGRGVQRLD